MKNGWRMKEIDEMDMLGFLRLRAWDATREQEKKKPRQRFIDEVWPGVKPGRSNRNADKVNSSLSICIIPVSPLARLHQ